MPEVALGLYEDAVREAQHLVNWPKTSTSAKKMLRLKELHESPLLEQRLAAALYQDYTNRKKPT